MYQIKRRNKIQEQLEILDKNDNQLYVLTVDINIDEISSRWNKALQKLADAQQLIQIDPNNCEAFGQAVIVLLELVFGAQQTELLINHYENNYGELLLDIFPFISDVIKPKIDEASKLRKEQLRQAQKCVRRRG